MVQRLLLALASGAFVNPVDYGAECDVDCVVDAEVDGGSPSTVTSATAAFSAGDTGKTFYLASPDGDVTTGTLTHVNSTTATMSVVAGGAITGGRLVWGTDDTDAWQDALDAALPGQTVDIADPNWRSLCIGQLEVPGHVKLGAEGRGPFDPFTNPAGTTYGPTFVVGQDATTPFITLNNGSGLGDFIFYSANQVPPTAPTATAFAAFVGTQSNNAAIRIGSPYFANAYVGIYLRGGRHHIGRPQIGALRTGIKIDFSQDVIDIDRVTCHPYWRICEGQSYTPTADSLDEYAQDNARGVEINRADAFKIGSIFTFGMYGALLSIDSGTEQGVECGYGMVGQLDSDNCVVGIDAWETNSPGILVAQAFLGSNGTGVGTAGSAGVATHTGGSMAPKIVVKSWSHRGSWSSGASSTGAGTTLIVPGTNPG